MDRGDCSQPPRLPFIIVEREGADAICNYFNGTNVAGKRRLDDISVLFI